MRRHLSIEYYQFLYNKILENLPPTFTKVGNKYNGRCPFCGDSKKSSTKKRGWIYTDNDCSYYCFNCGVGLSGIKFIEAITGSNYSEIKKEYVQLILMGNNSQLSAIHDVSNETLNLFEIKSIINPKWKNKLSDNAITYLNNRQILNAPFFDNNLYSCYNSDKSEEYILIPWVLNGVEAYYQINDFKKHHSMKYIFPKNKKKLIAGLDNIDVSFPYIIVFEGYYDSLFVKNGICVGTKAISDYQLNIIKERYPHHQIVISFDNDNSGIESMIRLVKKQNNFKYFKWFNKNTKEKDINDYILAKNNVNIFSDSTILEKLIIDKLSMKLFLIKNNLWKSNFSGSTDTTSLKTNNYGLDTFWKKRAL